jgi:hypothetical protein
MKYKGIEYKVLQTTAADVWAWSFDPPNAIRVHGKTKGTRPFASAAAERAINKWLRSSAEKHGDLERNGPGLR